MLTLTVLCAALLLALCATASAQPPPPPTTVDSWALRAFFGEAAPREPLPPGLEVRRQDHGTFRVNRSVLDTPLRVGSRSYRRGLGTHSVSEIVVRLPGRARRFRAHVGIDNNHDTAGTRGSAEFVVEAEGREIWRSGVLRGGMEPVEVDAALPGVDSLILRVTDGGDGPGWDQSDWCDPTVELVGGSRVRLDALPVRLPAAAYLDGPPISFTLGGRALDAILPGWRRDVSDWRPERGRRRRTVTWTDPSTGLSVAAEMTLFDGTTAAEWVVRLTNTGTADTPLIEHLRPLDLRLAPPTQGEVTLHHSHGSTCEPTDFLPIETKLSSGARLALSPRGGRSSDGALPFFNIEWPGGGLVGAIGWSGQWEMTAERERDGELRVAAGQQTTRFVLKPGETVRTPRILLVSWSGSDRYAGHDALRRLLLAHYVPRGRDGQPALPPISCNTWFTYNAGNDVDLANQMAAIAAMAPLGVDDYWLDAGWFVGGWPAGAGSWDPRPERFPDGLKPLGDAARKAGMGFVLWFEPERVNPESRIGREHPEWVLRAGPGDGLFNLGDPVARQWLTDYLAERIAAWGVTIYRNDFNIDPLRFWQAFDTPDRQGIAEMRYVEGLYALWDDLRARTPGLLIDNCASGGRRIDLETISRSFPLWRSDTQCCGRAVPVQDQVQTAGLSLYVPLHAAGVWGFDPYVWRSVVTTGGSLCMDLTAKGVPVAAAKRSIAEAKRLRPLWLGEYRPLLPITREESQWIGWQFHRPDLSKGFAMLFRRSASPYGSVQVELHGIEADGVYEMRVDGGTSRRVRGQDLQRLAIEIPSTPGSRLVEYGRVAASRRKETAP